MGRPVNPVPSRLIISFLIHFRTHVRPIDDSGMPIFEDHTGRLPASFDQAFYPCADSFAQLPD